MSDQGLIVGLSLSLALNFLVVPFVLWLSWFGIKIRFMKWKIKSGSYESRLFFDKGNNIHLGVYKRTNNRISIKNGTYISTPEPARIYRFLGMPLRITRENDPVDIDIWNRESISDLTSKELDNVVNENLESGLISILKQYFPLIVVAIILLAVLAIASLVLNYNIMDTLVNADIAKWIPDSLKING